MAHASSYIVSSIPSIRSALLVLGICIISQLLAHAQPIYVTITSDNAYRFAFGDVNGITNANLYNLVNNQNAADIYNSILNLGPLSGGAAYGTSGYGPERYTIGTTANLATTYIYIIAFSDKHDFQGTIAYFQQGANAVYTRDNLAWPWEVYATGETFPDWDEATINNYIALANANAGPSGSSSKGWVRTVANMCGNSTMQCEGRLMFCPTHTATFFPNGSPNYTLFDVANGTAFMWYQPSGNSENCATQYNFVNTTREYLIFRIGPLGDILHTETSCCPPGTTRVTSGSGDVHFDQGPNDMAGSVYNDGRYRIHASIQGGQVPIKEVSASLAYFTRSSSSPECSRCVNPATNYGSFINSNSYPNAIQANHHLIPQITDPNPPTGLDESSREVIWTNPNGLNADLHAPHAIEIPIQVPPPVNLPEGCCVDTIRMCIRYKFVDSLCLVCDTVICYQFEQTFQSNSPESGSIFLLPESMHSPSMRDPFSMRRPVEPIPEPVEENILWADAFRNQHRVK